MGSIFYTAFLKIIQFKLPVYNIMRMLSKYNWGSILLNINIKLLMKTFDGL